MKTTSSDYLSMLFENRNKEYGAYDLRINYERRLFKSFGMALLIAGLFFLVPYTLTQILTRKQIALPADRQIIYDFSKEYVIEKPQKPETPAFRKSISQGTSYQVVRKEEEKLSDPLKNTSPVINPVVAGNGMNADSANAGGDKEPVTGPVPATPMSAASVDVPPAFPGGQEAMIRFLVDNLHYPSDARKIGITGKIFVSFVIDEEGNTISISILKGLGYGMDEEVERVIRLMPKWSPGRYRNQFVQTAFIMPVSFTLK